MTQGDNARFLGRGWSFPPRFDRDRGSVLMTEGSEDIQRSLEILVTTAVGERVMLPRYGCDLGDLVFESLDTTTKTLIADRVRTAIVLFEPRIELHAVRLHSESELEGLVSVEVEYSIRATNSRFNFVFPYFKTEGTEIAFGRATGGAI